MLSSVRLPYFSMTMSLRNASSAEVLPQYREPQAFQTPVRWLLCETSQSLVFLPEQHSHESPNAYFPCATNGRTVPSSATASGSG